MAYYLRVPPNSNRRGSVDTNITTGSDWAVEIDVELTGSSLLVFNQATNNANNVLFFTNAPNLQLRRSASEDLTWALSSTSAPRKLYRMQPGVGGGVELFIDGVSQGTEGTTSTLFGFPNFFGFGTVEEREGNVYGMRFYDNGALIHHYDPSASNGSGTVLTDIVGARNMSLINFPTNCWVYYDETLGASTPTLTAKITGITATSAVPVIDVTF